MADEENLDAVLGQELDNVIGSEASSQQHQTVLKFSSQPWGFKGKGKKGKGKFGKDLFVRKTVGMDYICIGCGAKGDHWSHDCPQRYGHVPQQQVVAKVTNAAKPGEDSIGQGVLLNNESKGTPLLTGGTNSGEQSDNKKIALNTQLNPTSEMSERIEPEKILGKYEDYLEETAKKRLPQKIRWARGIPMNYLRECPDFESACSTSVDGICYLRRDKPGHYFAFVHYHTQDSHTNRLGGTLHDKVIFAYGEGLTPAIDEGCFNCEVCSNPLNNPEILPCCGKTTCRDCVFGKGDDKCPMCRKICLSYQVKSHPLMKLIMEKIQLGKWINVKDREKKEYDRRRFRERQEAEKIRKENERKETEKLTREREILVKLTYSSKLTMNQITEKELEEKKKQEDAFVKLHTQMLTDKLEKIQKKIIKKAIAAGKIPKEKIEEIQESNKTIISQTNSLSVEDTKKLSAEDTKKLLAIVRIEDIRHVKPSDIKGPADFELMQLQLRRKELVESIKKNTGGNSSTEGSIRGSTGRGGFNIALGNTQKFAANPIDPYSMLRGRENQMAGKGTPPVVMGKQQPIPLPNEQSIPIGGNHQPVLGNELPISSAIQKPSSSTPIEVPPNQPSSSTPIEAPPNQPSSSTPIEVPTKLNGRVDAWTIPAPVTQTTLPKANDSIGSSISPSKLVSPNKKPNTNTASSSIKQGIINQVSSSPKKESDATHKKDTSPSKKDSNTSRRKESTIDSHPEDSDGVSPITPTLTVGFGVLQERSLPPTAFIGQGASRAARHSPISMDPVTGTVLGARDAQLLDSGVNNRPTRENVADSTTVHATGKKSPSGGSKKGWSKKLVVPDAENLAMGVVSPFETDGKSSSSAPASTIIPEGAVLLSVSGGAPGGVAPVKVPVASVPVATPVAGSTSGPSSGGVPTIAVSRKTTSAPVEKKSKRKKPAMTPEEFFAMQQQMKRGGPPPIPGGAQPTTEDPNSKKRKLAW